MEIRSKFTVSIPRYLVNVLGIDEKTKFVPTFRDGKLELEIVSENQHLASVKGAVLLNLDQDEWVRSGIIAGRKGLKQLQGEAYEEGYEEGYDEGYEEGHSEGVDDGYDMGERDGYTDGYLQGYSDCKAGDPFDDSFPDDEDEDECDGDCENCPHRHD